MEFWNTKNLKAPPTYTYKAGADEIDIDHLQTLLREGIKFYSAQHLMNLETALLSRIVYRMKRKFRNSKDFKTLEKVKKYLHIYQRLNLSNDLFNFVRTLPNICNQNEVFLPTRNMADFILVRLQGIGKILCQVIEMCKLTVQYYECRLHLGHFWKLAIIAVALVSRIYILSLNIIKFTCLLYVRLLPFSHKLKNSGANWLPKNYVFPKDLKEWLNIEWSKFDEVIEIPDEEFDVSILDLVEDSDDDVEFCNEYIEVDEDEDLEIVSEFKRISRKKVKQMDFEKSITILRGFAFDNLDTGEVIPSCDESEVDILMNTIRKESPLPKGDQEKSQEDKIMVSTKEIDLGEVILSSDEDVRPVINQKVSETKDKGKSICVTVDSSFSEEHTERFPKDKKSETKIDTEMLISSDEESVQFVEEVACTKQKTNFNTFDFMSFDDNPKTTRFPVQNNSGLPKRISSKFDRRRRCVSNNKTEFRMNNLSLVKNENCKSTPTSKIQKNHLKTKKRREEVENIPNVSTIQISDSTELMNFGTNNNKSSSDQSISKETTDESKKKTENGNEWFIDTGNETFDRSFEQWKASNSLRITSTPSVEHKSPKIKNRKRKRNKNGLELNDFSLLEKEKCELSLTPKNKKKRSKTSDEIERYESECNKIESMSNKCFSEVEQKTMKTVNVNEKHWFIDTGNKTLDQEKNLNLVQTTSTLFVNEKDLINKKTPSRKRKRNYEIAEIEHTPKANISNNQSILLKEKNEVQSAKVRKIKNENKSIKKKNNGKALKAVVNNLGRFSDSSLNDTTLVAESSDLNVSEMNASKSIRSSKKPKKIKKICSKKILTATPKRTLKAGLSTKISKKKCK